MTKKAGGGRIQREVSPWRVLQRGAWGDHDPVLRHVQFYNKWKDFEGSGSGFWKAVDIQVEV